jgi:hypothetical protein
MTPDNQTPETRYVLPDASEANDKVRREVASALDRFIFFYQPYNGIDRWRHDLQAVVDELTALQPKTLRDMLQADDSMKEHLEAIREEFLVLKTDLEQIVKGEHKDDPRDKRIAELEEQLEKLKGPNGDWHLRRLRAEGTSKTEYLSDIDGGEFK